MSAEEALLSGAVGPPTAMPTATPTPRTGLIERVTTDKAMYPPGTPVQISIELRNRTGATYDGSITLAFYHLAATVADEQSQPVAALGSDVTAIHTYTWTPPPDDFKGYWIEVRALDQGGTNALDTAATAIDVSSDWKKFPRYGFVSQFGAAVDAADVMAKLNRCHLNGIQFYDWQWQHHRPYSPDERWLDIANRQISRASVTALIDEAHRYNMVAMHYSLAFGAYDTYWQDGSDVKVEWGLFKSSSNPTSEQQDFHPLPNGWATSKLYLMNPGNPAWQEYIFAQQKQVFEHFAFDGWHIDTLGKRGDRWDANGKPVDLAATYARFTNNAKAALQKRMLFNAVGGYGQDKIAASADVDFIYTELWEQDGIRTYADILAQAARARAKSDKALVFPAYMNKALAQSGSGNHFFNEASVRLADAVIFTAGAAHLELGDSEGMLSGEYFPSQPLVMSDTLKLAMQDYYDFLVAYQNLLRDGVSDSSNQVVLEGLVTSTEGQQGTAWTLVKTRAGVMIVHLINLTTIPSNEWRDSIGAYPVPGTLTNLALKVYYSGSLREGAKLSDASPDRDHGKAHELSYATGSDEHRSFVTATLPELQYWEMLWLDTEAK